MFGRKGLPDGWESIVAGHVAHWHQLDADERARLGEYSDWLLRKKHWETAVGFDGFELTDDIRVTIAAQAALLILGLDVGYYREVGAVVVWPTTIHRHGPSAGEIPGTINTHTVPLLGEAHDRRGPVLIAWDEALENARHPERGHNVVYHEFAHKIDMCDGTSDGTPPLHAPDQLEPWIDVCSEVFDALCHGEDRPPLNDYGATNVAEFFAVATEAFFDQPVELETNEPDLYDVLRDFYNQDPAVRVRGSQHPTADDSDLAFGFGTLLQPPETG